MCRKQAILVSMEIWSIDHSSSSIFWILYILFWERKWKSLEGFTHLNLQNYYSKYSFPEVCLKLPLLITCLIGAGFIYRMAHNDLYKNSWCSVYVHVFFQTAPCSSILPHFMSIPYKYVQGSVMLGEGSGRG